MDVIAKARTVVVGDFSKVVWGSRDIGQLQTKHGLTAVDVVRSLVHNTVTVRLTAVFTDYIGEATAKTVEEAFKKALASMVKKPKEDTRQGNGRDGKKRNGNDHLFEKKAPRKATRSRKAR